MTTLITCLLVAGVLLTAFPASATAAADAEAGEAWRYKDEFFPYLVKQVPGILESQDPETGRFGTGIWVVNDQLAIYPLAVAWSTERADNPYHRDPKVLDAVMLGGDALIADMDDNGQWEFRKKDGSTWGPIYMPWTYSRWIRAFDLIKDDMPADRRAKWEKALTLGFTGISRTAFDHVHNIPAHHAMGLYCAGKALNRPEWCEQAAAFMRKVVSTQDPGGFWSENLGPVVGYNAVYVDAIATYAAMSGDEGVVPALERAAKFHANFTYPDGSAVETIDERQVYHDAVVMPNVGVTFSPEGRGYLRHQWSLRKAQGQEPTADAIASYWLFGRDGNAIPPAGATDESVYVLGKNDAMTRRSVPWFTCLSAYHAPVPPGRWIQDRQNLVSLFHDKAGLILGGGNTKLQPLWSTFTAGDASLLKHTPGDENPKFTPPAGIVHVPTKAALDPDATTLRLEYGPAKVRVAVDVSDAGRAKLTYSLDESTDQAVAAHVPFMPRMGKTWQTASGKSGTLGDEPVKLAAGEAGDWFQLDNVRVSLPKDASITWPVLPHNPYRKDGSAEPKEGRFVVSLPLTNDARTREIVIEVP